MKNIKYHFQNSIDKMGRRGHDRMVVGFVLSSNSVHGEVYSIQHYVKKFVSELRQVGGILRVLRFPKPIKLTTTI